MKIKKLAYRAETYVFILFILFVFIVQFRSGVFFTGNNIVGILRSMIVPLTYALCAYLALISTGPDVSFPMIAALSTFLSIEIITNIGYEGPIILVYLIAMGFGLLMGMVNGFIIAKYNFPSLIVTLATSAIFTGLLFGTFEAMRRDLPSIMLDFGRTSLIHNPIINMENIQIRLPYAMLIVVALYLIAYFVLNKTMVGRSVFAVGGDEISAERAGFKVPAIRFGVFAVNGVIAAIAGVSYSVMTPMFFPVEFPGTEMIVIAAVVLGGTSLRGGHGTLIGCILGTLLLTTMSNSLILLGVPAYYQRLVIGIVIVIGTATSAILSDKTLFRRNKKVLTAK